ncbi:hypothetical protein Q8A67_006327 [Cirrhinus molitorella]|uniref:SGNH hydrolase-type esterase domain-containing protein n=1 Tax=Cirrhinus molitorella TaxID=172907 RepID=A0AA88TSM8_9TELE|nr:hypothetical protein Q8A67_006327 [Cirrhinus molitorella]
MADDSVPRVWIVRSSIIRSLYSHVCQHGLDRSLGLRCTVIWKGRGGRLWDQLLPVLRSFTAKAPAPDILIIHLGGNSLCREGRNRLDFLREMKTDLAEVFRMFPRTRLLFSSILPRLHWRGQTARSAYGVERSRRWLNVAISGFLAERQMRCIRHSNIDLCHLTRDGVHLSPKGNELLLSNLRKALQLGCALVCLIRLKKGQCSNTQKNPW